MKDLPELSVSDVIDLLSRSEDARSSILVGGQALNLWATRLGVGHAGILVSADVDFVGPATAAQGAAEAWGATEVILAGLDDHTPNTAVVRLRIAGGERQIDFLSGVMGVDRQELDAMAVPVEVPGTDSRMLVMHPLHCLQSHLHNSYDRRLHRRSHPVVGQRAADRARISVDVVRVSISDYLSAGNLGAAKRLVERVAELACTAAGCAAFHRDGIDVMDAIPADDGRWKEGFEQTVLKPLCTRVQKRRTAYSKRRGSPKTST